MRERGGRGRNEREGGTERERERREIGRYRKGEMGNREYGGVGVIVTENHEARLRTSSDPNQL